MTLPRAVAEVLSGHVTLEVRCLDRVLVTVRRPRLQDGQGIHDVFCQHRGNRFVSSTLMLPVTGRFAAGIRHYMDPRRLGLVRFARGPSKDQVAQGCLAGRSGGDQIVFAGVAKDKDRVWRTSRRRDPVTGSGTRGCTGTRRWPATGISMASALISARSSSSSAATSRTPGRSPSTVTSTPSSSASRPGSRSPGWTTRSARSATRRRSSGSATG